MTRCKGRWIVALAGLLVFQLAACDTYQEKAAKLPDTPLRGEIHISADESFRPIIEEEVKVYESNYRGTKINVHYKPEAECFKDLLVDSIRMIITTRGLSKQESRFVSDSLQVEPEWLGVARDAVAVIVHPQLADSLFTMKEIREVLTGSFKKNLIPVFDGTQATSTVRFIVDSVLRGEELTPEAMAAQSSEGVIDFVSRNPGSIGFIGVSWIGNKEDEDQRSFLKKVKIAHLESTDSAGTFVQPVQNNIYLGVYPMVRDLFYIRKERHRGLGYGFANFMKENVGQLIFKRAYLVPTQKKYTLRPIRLNE